jgi:glycosyltransferase involved in cell wall biosynthesis
MNSFKVSIIIPAYNAAKYIVRTFDSVINQTYKNIEIIIINDGSTDDTETIVFNYLKKDTRIIYLYQENKGCSASKNKGLEIASGDFIQYLDADDILSENKIECQLKVLVNNINKVAVCKTISFSDFPQISISKEIDTKFLFNTEDPIEFICNLYAGCGMVQPNAYLISKKLADLAGKWNENISPSTDEDSEYFCRVILNSKGIIYTENGINFYRSDRNITSLSRQTSQLHIENALHAINIRAQFILKHENTKRTRLAIGTLYSNFIYMYYENYPKLCIEAIKNFKQIGLKKIPISGGLNFQKCAKTIGMLNTLKLRAFINKIIKV